MKTLIFLSMFAVSASIGLAFCNKDHGGGNMPFDVNTGKVFSIKGDQSGRPLINITLIDATEKDNFNGTSPAARVTTYRPQIQSKLLALYPGFTTNVLGQSAAELANLFAKDVLTVSISGTTAYYNNNNVMTGRSLGDDVVDNHFLFIYGGPHGTDNPGLTSDHVDKNDKPFLMSFPYEAAPW
ncbi:MAG: DUF4331 family protein [Bacteroidota bacterium]